MIPRHWLTPLGIARHHIPLLYVSKAVEKRTARASKILMKLKLGGLEAWAQCVACYYSSAVQICVSSFPEMRLKIVTNEILAVGKFTKLPGLVSLQ